MAVLTALPAIVASDREQRDRSNRLTMSVVTAKTRCAANSDASFDADCDAGFNLRDSRATPAFAALLTAE